MNKIKTTEIQYLNIKGIPIDATNYVGSNSMFKTIDSFLTDMPASGLYEGMLVNDGTYGITWQLYKDDAGNFDKRVYDGTFHVKVVTTGDLFNMTGVDTDIQGVTINNGDTVLQVGGLPQLRGVYVLSDNKYTRHPIFKYVKDQLSNVIYVVDEGNTSSKNTQWTFTTSGNPTVYSDYNDGDSDNPLLWDDYFAVTPSDYLHSYLSVFGSAALGAIAEQVSPYYNKINEELFDGEGSPEDIIPETSDMWGVGVSDSWLNFEMINPQTLPIYQTTTTTAWDSHTRQISLDASSNNLFAYLPFNSTHNFTTSLTPNVEYSVHRIDDTSDYYGYVLEQPEDYTVDLPIAVLKEKEDYFKFKIYQNPTDVTDLSLITQSNRKVRNYDLGTLTSDYSDFSIPAGYNIFTVKATAGGGAQGMLGIGTTTDATDILNLNNIPTGKKITSDADLYFTWNKYNVNLTTPTTLYIKSIPDWSTYLSDISIEICCYQDNF